MTIQGKERRRFMLAQSLVSLLAMASVAIMLGVRTCRPQGEPPADSESLGAAAARP